MTGIERDDIHHAVMTQGLADSWCLETAVRYLLLSGLLSELVWFCEKMGDWKTALSVGIICDSHKTITMKHVKR